MLTFPRKAARKDGQFYKWITILLNKKAADGFGLTCGFFVIAIICCFAVTFVLSTSDKINAYYGKKEIMYD